MLKLLSNYYVNNNYRENMYFIVDGDSLYPNEEVTIILDLEKFYKENSNGNIG